MRTRNQMGELTIELLEPDKVDTVWKHIRPIVAAACRSNDAAQMDISPDTVYSLATTGMCVVFVGREKKKVRFVLVLQFTDMYGTRGAEIVAMGGAGMMKFKNAYWDVIVEWLKANGCKYIDACASERLANVYTKRFGFDRSRVCVRKIL